MVDGFDKVAGGAQHFGAGGRQAHTATGSLEYLDAQSVFHLANAAAQRRLFDTKFLSRAPEAPEMSSGDRIAQMSQFDARCQ
jgi:hypothetical protein